MTWIVQGDYSGYSSTLTSLAINASLHFNGGGSYYKTALQPYGIGFYYMSLHESPFEEGVNHDRRVGNDNRLWPPEYDTAIQAINLASLYSGLELFHVYSHPIAKDYSIANKFIIEWLPWPFLTNNRVTTRFSMGFSDIDGQIKSRGGWMYGETSAQEIKWFDIVVFLADEITFRFHSS